MRSSVFGCALPKYGQRSDKVHLRKGLEMTRETPCDTFPPLTPAQKITNFLGELPYKSPRGATSGGDGATKDTRAKSLGRACHQRMPCLLSSSWDPRVVIPFLFSLFLFFFFLSSNPLIDISDKNPCC